VAIDDLANYVATTDNSVIDRAKAVDEKKSTVDKIVAQKKTTK